MEWPSTPASWHTWTSAELLKPDAWAQSRISYTLVPPRVPFCPRDRWSQYGLGRTSSPRSQLLPPTPPPSRDAANHCTFKWALSLLSLIDTLQFTRKHFIFFVQLQDLLKSLARLEMILSVSGFLCLSCPAFVGCGQERHPRGQPPCCWASGHQGAWCLWVLQASFGEAGIVAHGNGQLGCLHTVSQCLNLSPSSSIPASCQCVPGERAGDGPSSWVPAARVAYPGSLDTLFFPLSLPLK